MDTLPLKVSVLSIKHILSLSFLVLKLASGVGGGKGTASNSTTESRHAHRSGIVACYL